MLEVKDKKTLLSLKNHEKGELVKVTEEDKTYHYDGEQWLEYEAPQFALSLYEINKQYYSNKEDLDDYGLNAGASLIDQFVNRHCSSYCMLLNNELHYYTLFEAGNEDADATITQELMNLLKYFDNVKAIELAENAIEIWATLNGEIGCFMFFDYTKGVIKCK